MENTIINIKTLYHISVDEKEALKSSCKQLGDGLEIDDITLEKLKEILK